MDEQPLENNEGQLSTQAEEPKREGGQVTMIDKKRDGFLMVENPV